MTDPADRPAVDPATIPDDPTHPFWVAEGLPPWPEWVAGFRPWQVDACRELVDGWLRGADVMVLDAPTGTGKTVIGEMCRRVMYLARGGSASYVCHSLRLQDQFLEDFGYARVVKGRGNYPTLDGPAWVTAADCGGKQCVWCDPMTACPYRVAKTAALANPLAVANTSYWLHEAGYVKDGLRGRRGLIVDECDTLESAVMGFVEVVVTDEARKAAGVGRLKKGAHRKTVAEWMGDVEVGLRAWANRHAKTAGGDVKMQRRVKAARGTAVKAGMLVRELSVEAGEGGDEAATRWVRDYRGGTREHDVVHKPVKVDQVAAKAVWGHVGWADGGWALAMSATVISADEWLDSCGVEAAGLEAGRVVMDSPFAVEHRPILYVPQGDMGYKTWERDVDSMVDGVAKILDRHPEDAVLIHTTSYKLNRAIVAGIKGKMSDMGQQGRKIVTHDDARGRDVALAEYVELAERGRAPIVCSPSLDRGVDLPGDLCRVQIIVKVPFPSLGDRQIAERMRVDGGQAWYRAQTARTLVQMTGRGVRSAEDHAVTYVLDSQFGRWWKQAKTVVPGWWAASVKPGRL